MKRALSILKESFGKRIQRCQDDEPNLWERYLFSAEAWLPAFPAFWIVDVQKAQTNFGWSRHRTYLQRPELWYPFSWDWNNSSSSDDEQEPWKEKIWRCRVKYHSRVSHGKIRRSMLIFVPTLDVLHHLNFCLASDYRVPFELQGFVN
jgi:hypothetical protein